MKRFLFPLIIFCCSSTLLMSQDILIKRNGEQIKTRVLKVNKKDVVYKNYDDPEFTTYTINEAELDKLKPEKGREYWFNHKLPRAYIGVNYGLSMAVGAFAGKSYDNASSQPGFGGVGPILNIEGGFYIWKRLGFHFKAGISANKFDATSLANNYKTDPSDTVNVSSGNNWGFGSFTFGPMYSVKLAKWLTWDNKVFIGMLSSSKPSYFVNVSNAGNSTFLNVSSNGSSKTDGCWGLATTFRLCPVKRIGFHLTIEYRNSSATQNTTDYINGTIEGVNVNSNSNPNSISTSKTYANSVVNVTAGVAFQFNRKRR